MERTLLNSGFIKCCETEFVHPGVGITVELTSDGLGSIEANGVDTEAIGAFVVLDLEAHPDRSLFGHRLVIGIQDMRKMSSTSADPAEKCVPVSTDDSEFEQRCRKKLPTSDELEVLIWPDGCFHITRERQLHIYTWGDAMMNKAALRARGSTFQINAKPLNGRGGGADITHNALQDPRIMLNIAGSLSDARGGLMLRQTVRKIEEEDHRCISVFCTKGRHRSVSMALLLRLLYYPNAIVEHLTIK